jgi:hypothetical protein
MSPLSLEQSAQEQPKELADGLPASWLHCRVGDALVHLRGMSVLAARVRYVPGTVRRGLASGGRVIG